MLATNLTLQVNQRFTRRVAGALGFSYGIVDFSVLNFEKRDDRTDDRWGLNFNILSKMTSYIDASFAYSYVDTSSTMKGIANERHLTSLSFVIQY